MPLEEPIFVQFENGTKCLEIQIENDKFIFSNQMMGPQQDYLVRQATTIYDAQKNTNKLWPYYFKMAWLYTLYLHKGEVLEKFQEVTRIVRLLGWDTPKIEEVLDADRIYRNYKLLNTFLNFPLKMLTNNSNNKIATITNAKTLKTDDLSYFNSRQYRQTITEYI